MLDKKIVHTISFNLFYVALFLGFVSLWFSPFLVSLFTSFVALSILPHIRSIGKDYTVITSVLILFILVALSDYLRSDNAQLVSSKVLLLLGLLTVQMATIFHFRDKLNKAIWFIIFSSFVVLLINVQAVTNYLMNKDALDQLLLQSKAIPILNMHHIHFGIINALVIILLIGLLAKGLVSGIRKQYVVISLILITLCFHILSSRTGLVSFYSGILTGIIMYAIHMNAYKRMFQSFLLIIVVLISAFYLSTSFRNKISNSIEDIESWRSDGDINFKSMGMRFEAYNMCNSLIAEHPFLGVGCGDMEKELQAMYVKQNTVLEPVNRVGPHNQFLEYGVKYGILGMLLVLAYFIMFIKDISGSAYVFIGILVMLFVAMMFESLLERQSSIFFASIFTSLGYNIFRK